MITTPSKAPTARPVTITRHEQEQVERANRTGRQPVVFVHGRWLLPSSWDRWAELFEEAGFTALTPGWPDDPDYGSCRGRIPRILGAGRYVMR